MNISINLTDPHHLARLIEKLFDRWRLTEQERSALLGCEIKQLENLLIANINAVETQQFAQRCGQLLHIHQRLRTLFPGNRELMYRWIKVSNKAFDGNSPLQLMSSDGAPGYASVIRYLDNFM